MTIKTMDIQLFNTLGREKQEFKSIEPGVVKIYTCGPTVYNYQHIGNFRTFFFEDILKRVLIYNGYKVIQIMNITDVGHLVSDADEGEDKMEKGAAREGKTVWEISKFYTEAFLQDMDRLNILHPTQYTKATDYIKEQIDMVKCLEDKGFTYKTSDGIYFDTSKIDDYGKLVRSGGLDISGLEEGKRIAFSSEKKNKTDFALWKFSPKGQKRQMEWDSPWGKGFPGWHIECSAMSRKFLGDTFDIHCGGVDHIPIHHTNEIAQSEACIGKKFVNYWLHGEFLVADGEKMAKSSGDFLQLQTLIDKGYDPMDYRYLCLGTHYRKRLLFDWELLDASRNAYSRLMNRVIEFKTTDLTDYADSRDLIQEYRKRFKEAIDDDLNVPEGIGVMWEVVRDEKISSKQKLELIYDFDKVFGLNLSEIKEKGMEDIPDEVMKLVADRTEAKKNKDFKRADEIRKKIKEMGYEVVDKKDGVEVKKIKK
jgi:cysteinyl-tRNA synthetase